MAQNHLVITNAISFVFSQKHSRERYKFTTALKTKTERQSNARILEESILVIVENGTRQRKKYPNCISWQYSMVVKNMHSRPHKAVFGFHHYLGDPGKLKSVKSSLL